MANIDLSLFKHCEYKKWILLASVAQSSLELINDTSLETAGYVMKDSTDLQWMTALRA